MQRLIFLLAFTFSFSLVVSSQNTSAFDLNIPGDKNLDMHYKPTKMVALYDSIITYDKNEQDQPWQLYTLQTNFFYDDANNEIAYDSYQYAAGAWHHHQKNTMCYNTRNQLTNKTTFGYVAAGILFPSFETIYEYDQNGNRTLHVNKWNIDDSLMINYRMTATYDDNSNQLTYTIERCSSDLSLVFVSQEVNTYVNNLMDTKIYFKWENGAWAPDQKKIYTRNATGLVSQVIIQDIFSTGEWVDMQKINYTYDNQGNCTEIITTQNNNGGFINKSRIKMSYSSNKLATYSSEHFIDNEWITVITQNNEYDANLNLIRHRCDELVNGEMVQLDDVKQSYDIDNIMTSDVSIYFNNYNVPSTLDGDSTLYYFKKVLGDKEQLPIETLTIYPNPTKDLIKINSSTPVITAELFNLSGIKLADYQINTSILNLSWLPNGTYLLRLVTNEGVYSKKILVSR